MNQTHARIVVAGAGSIGCFLGGALILAGRGVTLLVRERIRDEILAGGMRLTDYAGVDRRIETSAFHLATDPEVLAEADVILVTVKSPATAEMGDLIRRHGRADAIVVSFQNGVSNADTLRATLGDERVVAGMVPFNVVSLGGGRFHRGTSGGLVIGAGTPGLAAMLSTPLLTLEEESDMRSVQWGKLLLNLNNALNALSGLPLKEQLASREWRRLIADQMDEALAVLAAAGIEPAKALALPPRFLPSIMRLPTPLFRLISGRMLAIDPSARSSMWEDLQRRRRTEIDELQGACVTLAQSVGMTAPLCERIAALVRDAEVRGEGSPQLAPEEVAIP
ncbi:MAG: 2-dehydropantoate 2-reductase [Pseudomonadota bacterium]